MVCRGGACQDQRSDQLCAPRRGCSARMCLCLYVGGFLLCNSGSKAISDDLATSGRSSIRCSSTTLTSPSKSGTLVLDPAAFRNYGREAMSYTPPFAHLPHQTLMGRDVADYSNFDARAFYGDPGSFLHLAVAEPSDVLIADSEGRVAIRKIRTQLLSFTARGCCSSPG